MAKSDPQQIFWSFVLIGALAARLQGFPRLTADADITPARDPDNLEVAGPPRWAG